VRAPLLPLLAMLFGCGGDDLLQPAAEVGLAAASRLAAPSGLSAVGVSETVIALAWRDNSVGETGFELYRSASEIGPFGTPSLVGANATALSIEALQPSSQYCFKLRAIRRTGTKTTTSDFSGTACAMPLPPSVISLSVYPMTSTSVWMRWGGGDQTQYRVERSQDGGASWVLSAAEGHPGFTTESGLVSEQQVCYRIIAYNSGGEAAPSPTDCTAPPAAPTNLVGTRRVDTGVDLRWSDNSAVEDGYEVWARMTQYDHDCEAGCFDYTDDYLVGDLPANATSFTCQECVGWPTYVKAKKDGGASDLSNFVQVF
jgi:hypothetical protein